MRLGMLNRCSSEPGLQPLAVDHAVGLLGLGGHDSVRIDLPPAAWSQAKQQLHSDW
jgi:hypothetical protein